MENNQDVLLKVEHLKKYYSIKSSSLRGKKSVVKAVDDISFDVKIGETFGIVGESGCGKSTMGKSVIRLIEPTEGKVILDGQDFTSLKGKELQEARDKIKLIFQDPYASLNPRMTVKDIIAEPIDIAKCYKTKEERDAGYDIADFLLREETKETIFNRLIVLNPALKTLVETFDLQLVNVEKTPLSATVQHTRKGLFKR